MPMVACNACNASSACYGRGPLTGAARRLLLLLVIGLRNGAVAFVANGVEDTSDSARPWFPPRGPPRAPLGVATAKAASAARPRQENVRRFRTQLDDIDQRMENVRHFRTQLDDSDQRQENVRRFQTQLDNSDTGAAEEEVMRKKMRNNTIQLAQYSDVVGVAMISCHRSDYLERAMKSLLRAERDPLRFPLVIFQDAYGGLKKFDTATTVLISQEHVKKGLADHVQHPHDQEPSFTFDGYGGNRLYTMRNSYEYVAEHYKFAMRQMFDVFGFKQVIFLEEDLEVSPDFFSYFDRMLPLLKQDSSLFCVSAWNDNGDGSLVGDPEQAYRTDFFGGLGWMLQKSLWDQVRARWPAAYWDDFMREPPQRKGRQCIRPDVSRTYTFGEHGVSEGQFFKAHLQGVKLNEVPVDWSKLNISYLSTQHNFDEHLAGRIRMARPVNFRNVFTQIDDADNAGIRILYEEREPVIWQNQVATKADAQSQVPSYEVVAKRFGLMEDKKATIRRMSYRGVIPFFWKGKRVFLHTKNWPHLS